jgi:diacylglycerol kinase family enzyme
LNHFARDLGLPLVWRDAIAALANGECRAVDVGEVNGRVFINNCSIGSYADAVRRRDALRRLHGIGKWWAMTLATITVFRRLRRLRVRIEANGRMQSLRAPFVVVSNNRYSGHVLDYSLRSRLDEGRLWIYTTRAYRHAAVLRLMWQSLLRKIDAVDALEMTAVTSATLDYDYGRLPVAVDGELVDLRPPLRFRTRPAALRVLAPRRESSAP